MQFLTYYRNPTEFQDGRSLGALDLSRVVDVRASASRSTPGPAIDLVSGC